MAGVPDGEDTAGSVVVKPSVFGPQEQVALFAQTSRDLQLRWKMLSFESNVTSVIRVIPERSRC